MRVEQLYRYPVKGLSAEALENVAVAVGACLPHDRRFAVAQGTAPFDVDAPEWLPKYHFACLMRNESLAALRSAFDPTSGTLTLRREGAAPFAADVGTAAGRQSIAAYVQDYLGPAARGTMRFVEAPGHNFTDVATKAVHIVGLASIAALEAATGERLDPLRFRANVYVSGGYPWWEFDLVDREIQLGTARLRVFKRTVRCAATQVDPARAVRDSDPPKALRTHFGHMDLGVYAEVIEPGRIAVGDALEALEPDLLRVGPISAPAP